MLLELSENLIKDTVSFRSDVDSFCKGEMLPAEFRKKAAEMGVYQERTKGSYMVRARIGAGIMSGRQAEKIAEISSVFGNGIVHITTRQDVQVHGIKLENVADAAEKLLEAGLSSRGGGGNTVRNVTACPRSGVCVSEIFDVAPYAISTAEFLLQNENSFLLPRKYKIVFSGCSSDCAMASVADLGFFAKIRDGVKGFSVYAGGGLGRNPKAAFRLESFAEAEKVHAIAEAVRRLFSKYGDRENRNKARLRYVLERLGEETFRELYFQEMGIIEKEGLGFPVPALKKIDTFESEDLKINAPQEAIPDKQRGFSSLKIHLSNGNIKADQLVELADITNNLSQGFIRTCQSQDLIITSIRDNVAGKAIDRLDNIGLDIKGNSKQNIVSCVGASVCRIGICDSKKLAKDITKELNRRGILNKETIRISGCANMCSQHAIAFIGMQGRIRTVDGERKQFFDIFHGGQAKEGGVKFAEKVESLAYERIPEFVADQLVNNAEKP